MIRVALFDDNKALMSSMEILLQDSADFLLTGAYPGALFPGIL